MRKHLEISDTIPWFLPEVGQRDQEMVLDVLKSNYINDGEVTRLFESRIAEFLGVKHCVAVTSGTAAIALSLMGLGIGAGDEVIVPDLTFIATANAAKLAGADVKLVDVEPRRFTLDTEKVVAVINKRTRAIVPVDVNGRGADYPTLERIASDRGLFIVSDSAEALGSKWKGNFLGTFGSAGCFSFSANKTVTTGQGGMIATNDTRLYHRLLELKDQGRRIQGTGGNDLHPVLGFNFKLTNIQAAVGLAQLEKLQARLHQARMRDGWYRSCFAGQRDIIVPLVDTDQGEVLQWTDILVRDRDRVERTLNEKGVNCRPFWYPLHTQQPYASGPNEFGNSSKIAEQGLWLPSSFNLTEQQAQYTAELVIQAISDSHD
jgi:perosamine synthetase